MNIFFLRWEGSLFGSGQNFWYRILRPVSPSFCGIPVQYRCSPSLYSGSFLPVPSASAHSSDCCNKRCTLSIPVPAFLNFSAAPFSFAFRKASLSAAFSFYPRCSTPVQISLPFSGAMLPLPGFPRCQYRAHPFFLNQEAYSHMYRRVLDLWPP